MLQNTTSHGLVDSDNFSSIGCLNLNHAPYFQIRLTMNCLIDSKYGHNKLCAYLCIYPKLAPKSSFLAILCIFSTCKAKPNIKVKVPLDIFSPVVSNSRGRCTSRFQAVQPALVQRQFLLSRGQHDYRTLFYLPTKMVPIYLLSFACFQTARLARRWDKVTGGHSVAWIRSYDCWSSDPAAQASAVQPAAVLMLLSMCFIFMGYFFILIKNNP